MSSKVKKTLKISNPLLGKDYSSTTLKIYYSLLLTHNFKKTCKLKA